jgi:predicted AlkP superfamily pyrophosphatase or phosphodiesterase
MRHLLGILLAAASTLIAQTTPKDRMVIVISLDGFPAYALDDPKLPIPTLRKLIHDGGSARMTTVNPTVTWPNHTSMVTGVRADQHGLIANGTIINAPTAKVEPMIDKEKMVHAPTVYDAAHTAGLTTAQVDWVAISNAPSITWNFNEWATPEGPLEQEMIKQGVVSEADLDKFTKSNILHRDQIWTTAAAYLIRQHKPNLLLVHFLTLDSVHHQYGPNSLAATSAMAFLDSCVARIVEATKAAGMLDRTTFLIVSDHGFKKYTKQVRPAVALASAGLAGQVHILPEGGTAYVYFDKAEAAALVPKIKQALNNVEGIAQVLEPSEFPALGLPAQSDPQMYQLLLTAKDGYSYSGAAGGPVTAEVPQQAGSHGYLATDPEMDAIFIASGYGVKPNSNWGKIANVDVASTIANLLNFAFPGGKGKPIPLR